MDHPDNKEHLDPDVWTVTSLVVAIVSMVAQLATLHLPDNDANPFIIDRQFEMLQQEIKSVIRSVEKLVRLLTSPDGKKSIIAERKFEFGDAVAFFSQDNFHKFMMINMDITFSLTHINDSVLSLIHNDPSFAKEIGDNIRDRVTNIKYRVIEMQYRQRTIGSVLDDCLDMLRQFYDILDIIERRKN